MNILELLLGALLKICYEITGEFGAAIIIFTLCSKIILLPISIWVHKNSIKVVAMQPEINHIKADYFGDEDKIAEETSAIYKRGKYNHFASIIPVVLQLLLLVGVIGVINQPLKYIIGIDAALANSLVHATHKAVGFELESSSVELYAVATIQSGVESDALHLLREQYQLEYKAIQSLEMDTLGINLAATPISDGGTLIWIPVLAGLAAALLCVVQNRLSPLQAEQRLFMKLGVAAFSVGLSFFLGLFVPVGVGVYWISSNIFTIVQQAILSKCIDPQKNIDYIALRESKERLRAIQSVGTHKNAFKRNPHTQREKQDYKKFFSIENKHLVFYSEKSGFYKYFGNTIDYLLSASNVTIHYVTSDPHDAVFELANENPRIKPYYIGEKKLITLFMKMDAKVVVMTMSDLQNYHYKRSYVSDEIEYIYMFHYPLSTHMVLAKGALDHYDTVFCVGNFQVEEIRQWEGLCTLPPKNLIPCGYGQLEKLQRDFDALPPVDREYPKILIAPSWQEGNILDSCLDELLQSIVGTEFFVVIRPHPEYVRRYKARMDAILLRYKDYSEAQLAYELDFSSNASLIDSDVVITDWSGTAYEFSFVTKRPVIFINTPPKIHNPDYSKIQAVPLEMQLRNRIGVEIDPSKLGDCANVIRDVMTKAELYSNTIKACRDEYIANFGSSGEVGGKYILDRLTKKEESL